MKQILICIFTLVAIFDSSVRADEQSALHDCSSKTCFPKSISIGEAEIPLLGSKLFRYYVWTAYSIALYGPPEARSIDAILSDVPKKLILNYRRDFEAEDIIEAANKLLEKNPDVDLDKMRPQLAEINKLYTSIKEGESYALEYEPGKGTSLLKNDRLLGTVAGADFARHYFGIWLSKYPIDHSMRDRLLGAD